MCSKKKGSFLKTATVRLTLWYTLVFGGLSFAVFLIVYLSLMSHLRVQTDKELLNSAREFAILYETRGRQALHDELMREAESRGVERVFFRLLTNDGKVLTSSDLSYWQDLHILDQHGMTTPEKKGSFSTRSSPDSTHKIRVVTIPAEDGRILEIGMTLQGNEILMERYRETSGWALFIMLICGGFVGWLLARKSMSGVRRVTRIATGIGMGGLGQRVPTGNEGEEINALASAFNDMLERIENLVKELKQVTDNVAHELRTPVTRIRGIAETTLSSNGNIDDYREMAASVIEDSDRLISMINTMLEITRAGSGFSDLNMTSIDMREIAEDAVDLFAPAAEEKKIIMQLNTSAMGATVTGDRSGLQRVVANLIDNAIRYTPEGGKIMVTLRTLTDFVSIEIADTGIGIEKKDMPLIFDRFYRCDKSRAEPGSGLGLSLALAITKAHCGKITVKSTPGTGSSFTILLPISQPIPAFP